LDKRGLLPYPKIKNVKINFRYRSPLALVKGEQDIARFTRYFQLLQGMYGQGNALTYINSGLAPFLIAEQMQVDMRYLNSPEQVTEAAQQLQNQQDAMIANAQQNEQQDQAIAAADGVQQGV